MGSSDNRIVIDYYSDILCVWAWIAQPRLEQLEKEWGDKVSVRHHFVDIFGDCQTKIPERWGKEDGYRKFNEHVLHSAEPFEQAQLHPEIWTSNPPCSSAQAHLVLRAVALLGPNDMLAKTALRIRRAFFCEAKDVSDMQLLLELAEEEGGDRQAIQSVIDNGQAIAALMRDLRQASDLGISGSPTWILNGGRQTLYGNVGYRILNANIEELLKHPGDEASWC